MTRSKKIFAAFALVFVLFLILVVYDISTRTTFPGSRPVEEQPDLQTPRDSVSQDTTSR